MDILATGFQRLGHTVRRFERESPTTQPSLPRRLYDGVCLTYRLEAGRAFRGVVRDFKPDIVHFHNIWPYLTASVIHEAHRAGAKTVLTAHNYRLFCPAGTLTRRGRVHTDCITGSSLLCGLRGARDSRAEGAAYGLALTLQRRLRLLDRWLDAIVCPSAFMRAILAQAGFPDERLHVIPNGVALSSCPPARGQYALYVGRLSAEKGIRYLALATRLAPNVPLVVVGDGPLAEIVRHEAHQSVTLLGPEPPDAVARHMCDAAFGVVPSTWYENLPMVVLEFFAAGKPVIATPLGGLPELVDDTTGVLVAPAAPDALADAMRRLWANRGGVMERGRVARERVVRDFDIDKTTSEVTALYRSLLD